MLKKGDVWFTAVMLRGFMELYQVDGNKVYLDSFARSLDYAWTHAREENGLFNTDFTGKSRDNRKLAADTSRHGRDVRAFGPCSLISLYN